MTTDTKPALTATEALRNPDGTLPLSRAIARIGVLIALADAEGRSVDADALRMAEAALRAQGKVCTWRPMGGDNYGSYDGSCGVAWSFMDGHIADNDCHFCPRCGGRIIEETAPQTGKEQ